MGKALGFTRQTIRAQLIGLKQLGYAEETGRGPATRWSRLIDASLTWPLDGAAEDEIWRQIRDTQSDLLEGATDAATRSLAYGITEMVNNAIDHSEGTQVRVSLRRLQDELTIEIVDDGVGVFGNVRRHFDLSNEREAVAHLSKGKQTTASSRHSGQGIFFTSKIVDQFILQSHLLTWWVDNRRNDQTIRSGPNLTGTRVAMTINLRTSRMPAEVFNDFTDPDTLDFDKSTFHVKLVQYGIEFVSRSEAKRLANQLQLFGEVIVDFQGIEAVGQGFVDELFRVWVSDNPGTRLIPINMNDDVRFMVNRGLG